MLIIKRDSGFSGRGCNIVVFLDGSKLAELSAGEKVETYIAPGKHMVGARATGLCPKSTPEASFVMAPHATETFRVGFNEASMFIQPSAF